MKYHVSQKLQIKKGLSLETVRKLVEMWRRLELSSNSFYVGSKWEIFFSRSFNDALGNTISYYNLKYMKSQNVIISLYEDVIDEFFGLSSKTVGFLIDDE